MLIQADNLCCFVNLCFLTRKHRGFLFWKWSTVYVFLS